MLSSRFIALFALIILLVELLDPTTPFVRAYVSPVKSGTAAVTKFRSVSTLPVPTTSLAKDADQKAGGGKAPIEKLRQAHYHYAIHTAYCAFPSIVFHSMFSTLPTGLKSQYHPPIRKRPPIV